VKSIAAFILSIISTSSSFAQILEFSEPVLLSNQINSLSEEVSPMLTPDGNSLYFVRALDERNTGGKIGGMDIWRSNRGARGQWQQALNEVKWNNKDNNAVIGISSDGKTVYLLNAYKNRNGIAFSKLYNGKWTAPQIIPIGGISRTDLVGFYMNPSFNVLVMSRKDKNSFGQEDLYVCTKDSLDRWSEPVNLGATINTAGFEISPFLSSDEKRLYFSSNGQGGYGDADIFVSERLYDSWTVWSKPRNLGTGINSEKFDAYFSLYGDSISFFASNRNADFSDIYQSRIKIRSTSTLKDSVNSIVAQTKKLLTEVNRTNSVLSADIEYVVFRAGSTELSAEIKKNIETLLMKYQGMALEEIEIVTFVQDNETTKRTQNLVNYFIQKGVAREKIKIRKTQEQGNSSNRNIFPLEFYIKK
jgi:hypothetical protein